VSAPYCEKMDVIWCNGHVTRGSIFGGVDTHHEEMDLSRFDKCIMRKMDISRCDKHIMRRRISAVVSDISC
jgi:hypothetical protein